MSSQAGLRHPRPFRFENYWIKIPGFHEEVKRAWCKPIAISQPILALHNKMAITARHLRAWSRSIISYAKLKLHMALEVIQQLETAQESRELSSAERLLQTRLKKHVMALAIIERARKKKASRIMNLRLWDANTNFFRTKTNGRKNFIQRLHFEGGWAMSHEDKANIAKSHFCALLGLP